MSASTKFANAGTIDISMSMAPAVASSPSCVSLHTVRHFAHTSLRQDTTPMSDIVPPLRAWAAVRLMNPDEEDLVVKAADEIERLRAVLPSAIEWIERLSAVCDRMTDAEADEIERVLDALRRGHD
jgi:hypothetical protein